MNLTSEDSSATSGGGDFADFVVARGPSLHRTALLLTYQGQSAQDLVQVALGKAWRSWAQLGESPEAQVRAIMINEFVSSWRWRRRGDLSELPELPTQGGDDAGGDDDGDAVSMRQVLMAALAILPRRQRAVVVLRFFHDYTEAATAEALGVKVATVTSQTVKALGALRVFEELRQGATPDLSDSAQAGDVPLQRTLHDLRVALNEQADAAPYPDVGALVAGARRAAATRRRPLTALVATTAGALRNNWLPWLSVFLLIVGVGIGVFLGRVTKADISPPPDLATTSVTKMLTDLAKALNVGDAAAIATFYAPSATFNDPSLPDGTGVLTGNTTIADQLASWQERGFFVDSSGTYIQRGKMVAHADNWTVGSGVVVWELGADGKIVSQWILANKPGLAYR